MGIPVLDALTGEKFAVEMGFVSTVEATHRLLARSNEVRAVRLALEEGILSESTIRRFVASMLDDLKRGARFPHDLPMAALAVALERRPGDFADEFLTDLGRLKLAEMSISIRVARLCLRRRVSVARTKARKFDLRKSRASVVAKPPSPRIAPTPSPEVTFRGSASTWKSTRDEGALCRS